MTKWKAALFAIVAIVVMGGGVLGYTLAEAGTTSSAKVDRAQTRVGLIEQLLIDVDGLLASDEIALTPKGERLVEAGMQRSLEALEEARLELRGVRAELMRKRYQVQTQAAPQSWTLYSADEPGDDRILAVELCNGQWDPFNRGATCNGRTSIGYVHDVWINAGQELVDNDWIPFPGRYAISFACEVADQGKDKNAAPTGMHVGDGPFDQGQTIVGQSGTVAARQYESAHITVYCAGEWTVTLTEAAP